MKNDYRLSIPLIVLAAALLLPGKSGFASDTPTASRTDLYKAISSEDYVEARRQADALLKSNNTDQHQAASLAYGRILLGLGEKEAARKYRAMMARQSLDQNARQLMAVYDAWLLALDGRQDVATGVLEEILTKRLPMPSTIEAADVLSRLYQEQNNTEKSQEAISVGKKVLQTINPKPAYLVALLNNRLGGENVKAQRLFDQAEILRNRDEYREAGKLYLQIQNDYSLTDCGQKAGYYVGQCLTLLGNDQQALDSWKSFIDKLPSGPWRGQAQVGIIDLALGHFGDPALAAKHAAQAAAVLDAKLDRKAEPSWQETAFAIYIRHGAIALAAGRSSAAAKAFSSAVQCLEDPKTTPGTLKAKAEVQAGLDRLKSAVKQRLDILPEDLRTGDPKIAACLAIGNLYNLLRQYEPAKSIFDLPLGDHVKTSSRPLRSFAALGRARALLGLGDRTNALVNYQRSLEEYDRASWHDETLRELAILVEQEPAANTSATSTKVNNKSEKKPPRGASRKSSSVMEISSREDALPLWTKLLGRYPKSRHAAEALFHIGVLHAESDRWPQAVECWDRLTREHPDSPWAGDAHVRLVNVRLDRQLDLSAAQKCAAAAVDWLDRFERATAAAAGRSLQGERPFQEIRDDLQWQAGLLAYLDGRNEEAVARLEKAKHPDPPKNTQASNKYTSAELDVFIKTIQSGKTSIPESTRQGDSKTAVMLMQASLYQQAEMFDPAIFQYNRILNGKDIQATRSQRSWAVLQRGRCRANLSSEDRNINAALADYQAAVTTDPNAEWAPDALFAAASMEWNFRKDSDRAIRLWQGLVRQYPENHLAAKSAYHIAMTFLWTNRPEEARNGFLAFIERYPDSMLAAAAKEQLKKLEGATSDRKSPKVRP